MEPVLNEIFDATIDGDAEYVQDRVEAALADGIAPERILKQGLIAAMQEVGALFEEGFYFVPEMLTSSRAMKSGLAVLQPHLVSHQVAPVGKALTATVKDDLHDIGKRLLGIMLEGMGFEVSDLGVNVSPQQIVNALQQDHADIVALSALLTTTLHHMKGTVDALAEAGLRGRVKVIVGGVPVTAEFAREIGADGYAPDASRGARLALDLVSASRGWQASQSASVAVPMEAHA